MSNEKRVFIAMLVTGAFVLAELVGGLLAGSLALLADAGHMLGDSVALALAWLAFRVSRRPADQRRSYGYHRFQVLAAFINGATLLAIAVWIVVEAARRLLEPIEVLGGLMLVVAVLGLAANAAAFLVLRKGARTNLNVRGALGHVVGDLLGSAAAITAAAVILWTGWMRIDPILSIGVALLILWMGWKIVRKATHILLEGTPEGLDVERLRAELSDAVPAVEDIHHIHVWALTTERPVLTLHASVREGANYESTLHAIQDFLAQSVGIRHATIQIETGRCPDDIEAEPERGDREG